MRGLIISKFDVTQGPIIKYSLPSVTNQRMTIFKEIPRLMDLINDEGFFIHTRGNIYSANYFFQVDSSFSRGKKESILITIAFGLINDSEEAKERTMDFMQKQEKTMQEFMRELRSNEQLELRGFFSEENAILIKELLKRYYRRIFIKNSEYILRKDRIGNKAWIMTPFGYNGLDIINTLQKQVLNGKFTSFSDRLMQFALGEMKFTQFNCDKRETSLYNCPVCKRYFLETNVNLFILDLSDGDSLSNLVSVLNHLESLEDVQPEPLFILCVQDKDLENKVNFSYIQEIGNIEMQNKHNFTNIDYSLVTMENLETFFEPLKRFFKTIF